jgi:hypothetical protein
MYITASPGLGQPTFTAAEQSTVQGLISQAVRNENALTNRVFADRHPGLKGKALTSGTPSSREWIAIRDGLVRPALAAVPITIIPSRPCCILAPEIPAIGSNIADPASLGTHRDATEVNGIIYTGRAGFVDLGHIREECDLTEFVWIRLQGSGGAPTTIPTVQGEAKIVSRVPRQHWPQVAAAIAFDDGLGHEIFTYDLKGIPGGHNSAFSPDDLCSNFLGTLIARWAIGRGGPFNAQVTALLTRVLKVLRAQPPAETRKAFDAVKGRWIGFTGPSSVLVNDYLRRRNFSRRPFKAGHKSDAATPGWLLGSFGSVSGFYTYSHTSQTTIPKADFPAKIQAIRADAKILYGNDFDKP